MSKLYVLCSYYGSSSKLYSYVWGGEAPPQVGDLMLHKVGGKSAFDIVEVRQIIDSVDNLPYRKNLATLTRYAIPFVGEDWLSKYAFLRSLHNEMEPTLNLQQPIHYIRRDLMTNFMGGAKLTVNASHWILRHYFNKKTTEEWIKYGVERKENYLSK